MKAETPAPDPTFSIKTGSPPTAIAACAVSKVFSSPSHRGKSVHAVQDVSLTISAGEIVAVLGPNGAGKTTLIDMLLGLTTPTTGKVQLLGETPRAAVKRGDVGAVMQTGGLLPDLTVRDIVSMVAATFPDPRPIDEVLADANLTEFAGRRIKKCSGGEQQRVKFALATLARPKVLFLDEPTAGMDPGARRHFWARMREYTSKGVTIVFATHYLEEAEHFAERIVLMSRGEIVADGTVSEVQKVTAGTSVSCVLSNKYTLAQFPDSIKNSVSSHTREGGRASFLTSDSDSLARYLLTRTDASEVLVNRSSLDDAFLALTDNPHSNKSLKGA